MSRSAAVSGWPPAARRSAWSGFGAVGKHFQEKFITQKL